MPLTRRIDKTVILWYPFGMKFMKNNEIIVGAIVGIAVGVIGCISGYNALGATILLLSSTVLNLCLLLRPGVRFDPYPGLYGIHPISNEENPAPPPEKFVYPQILQVTETDERRVEMPDGRIVQARRVRYWQ